MHVGIKGWALDSNKGEGAKTLKSNIGEGASDVFQSQTTRIIGKERVLKTTLDVTSIILNSIKILYFPFP